MFDQINIHTGPRLPSSVHVHEHRAPTDASVRMLRELEQAALERVLASGRLADNVLDGEWLVIRDDFDRRVTAHLRYVLNGKERRVRVDLPGRWMEPQVLAETITTALQRDLAEVLTLDLFLNNADALPISRSVRLSR